MYMLTSIFLIIHLILRCFRNSFEIALKLNCTYGKRQEISPLLVHLISKLLVEYDTIRKIHDSEKQLECVVINFIHIFTIYSYIYNIFIYLQILNSRLEATHTFISIKSIGSICTTYNHFLKTC
jgi:hypothetical protein